MVDLIRCRTSGCWIVNTERGRRVGAWPRSGDRTQLTSAYLPIRFNSPYLSNLSLSGEGRHNMAAERTLPRVINSILPDRGGAHVFQFAHFAVVKVGPWTNISETKRHPKLMCTPTEAYVNTADLPSCICTAGVNETLQKSCNLFSY